jgi:hypothetical protein
MTLYLAEVWYGCFRLGKLWTTKRQHSW